MRLNLTTLFRSSAIACLARSTDPDAERTWERAHAVILTEDTVAAARHMARDQGLPEISPNCPEVETGQVILLMADTRQLAVRGIAELELGVIQETEDGRKLIPFTGPSLFTARQSLAHLGEAGALDINGQRALAGIQGYFEHVLADPQSERHSAGMVAQAYMASITDSYGPIDFPVSDAEIRRKAAADALRREIAAIDPAHADAMGAGRGFVEALAEHGLETLAAAQGGQILAGGRRATVDQALRNAVAANERLCRDVFGAMTRTSIDDLDVSAVRLASYEALLPRLDNQRHAGPWMDEVRARVATITCGVMPGYESRLEMISDGGRDFLFVVDTPSRAAGFAAVYSWPTESRQPLMEIGAGRSVNISAADIPSEAEIARLTRVRTGLLAEREVGLPAPEEPWDEPEF